MTKRICFVALLAVPRVLRALGLGKLLCFSTKHSFVEVHSSLLIGLSQLLIVSTVNNIIESYCI